jgi:hypothetical protein
MLEAWTPEEIRVMWVSFQAPALDIISVFEIVHTPIVFAATMAGVNVQDLAGSPADRCGHQATLPTGGLPFRWIKNRPTLTDD